MASPPRVFDTPDGARLAFRHRAGSGPCLVLAHPHTGDSRSFDAVLALYAGPVLTWDRRGYGQSTRGTYQTTQEQDLLALLDHLHIGPIVGVGIAAGGASLVGLAALHPERLRALGLVCSFMGLPARFWRDATGEAAPTGTPEDHELSATFRAGPDLAIWQKIHAEGRAQDAGEPPQCCNAEISSLRSISPLSLATGAQDRLFTPAMLDHAKTLLPRADCTLFPDAAHAPHIESPQHFADWLTTLVSRA